MTKYLNYPNHQTLLFHQKGILNDGFFFIEDKKKYLIIVDANVYTLHNNLFKTSYTNVYTYIIVASEENKSIEEYQKIIDYLFANNFTRNDEIIAIGGGIISDLSLYVSATYKRGMNITLIPTTLLAMVDASIGGKCGINYQGYKNQLGTFYFPKQIIIDETFLETLSNNEFNNGFSEIIKYSIIKDEEMFDQIEQNQYQINELIDKCIDIKIKIVTNDLYDNNERKLLNFGHTYGHIVESHSNFLISHGHSVAIGMYKEISNEEIKSRLFNILSKMFDIEYPLEKDEISKYLIKDKKMTNDYIDVVFIEKIGYAKVVKKKVEELIDEYIW